MPQESHEAYSESPGSTLLLALAGLGLLALGAHHLNGVLRVLLIRLEDLSECIADIGGLVS